MTQLTLPPLPIHLLLTVFTTVVFLVQSVSAGPHSTIDSLMSLLSRQEKGLLENQTDLINERGKESRAQREKRLGSILHTVRTGKLEGTYRRYFQDGYNDNDFVNFFEYGITDWTDSTFGFRFEQSSSNGFGCTGSGTARRAGMATFEWVSDDTPDCRMRILVERRRLIVEFYNVCGGICGARSGGVYDDTVYFVYKSIESTVGE